MRANILTRQLCYSSSNIINQTFIEDELFSSADSQFFYSFISMKIESSIEKEISSQILDEEDDLVDWKSSSKKSKQFEDDDEEDVW